METPLDNFVLEKRKLILDIYKKIVDGKLYHLTCVTDTKENKIK